MKIWTCYDNLPAQQWTYTSDDTIVLTGTGTLIFHPTSALHLTAGLSDKTHNIN